MSTTTYKVTSQKQLIDLNGDKDNFDITFTADSLEPFEALVVDQEMLDSGSDTDYKYVEPTEKSNGVKNASIGGNLVANSGTKNNFYLSLKAKNPCDVNVKIENGPIPQTVKVQKDPPPLISSAPKPPGVGSNWKTILVLIAVGLLGYLLWQYFNKTTITSVIPLKIPTPVATPVPSIVPSVCSSPTHSVANSVMSVPIGANDLLARLNSLAM